MNILRVFTIAFALMAVSLPLISVGFTADLAALWMLGFGALILGALIPPIMRFAIENPDIT